MDCTSAGFRNEMSRLGTPSTMKSGLLLPIVPSPRIRILISSPGAPVLCVTARPATCPCKTCATSGDSSSLQIRHVYSGDGARDVRSPLAGVSNDHDFVENRRSFLERQRHRHGRSLGHVDHYRY